MTSTRIWLNAATQVTLDLSNLQSPTWLRQLIVARRVVPGWSGALLG